jgi:2-iminobutanoate/2-iminopropanoate deaminase
MRQIIHTEQAPKAIGPYSQAVICPKDASLIFIAGQIPLDPATMQVLSDDISEQTKQVLKNLSAILAASGSSPSKVLKTTLFLKDMNDFKAVNDVYATFFKEQPPARSTVEVSRLPRDVRIEIEAIATT